VSNSAGFWNLIAKRYAKQPYGDEEAYKKKLSVTQSHFKPDMNVLEIGCGTGTTAITHAPHVKHIHAIDFSSKMIEIAQAKQQKEGIDNISFVTSTIDAFSTQHASFDVVLGLSILHLLPHKDQVIKRVYDITKKNGVFISSTVCIGRISAPLKCLLKVGSFLHILPLVKFFTPEQLIDSLKQAGFTIEYTWKPKGDMEKPDIDETIFIVARKL